METVLSIAEFGAKALLVFLTFAACVAIAAARLRGDPDRELRILVRETGRKIRLRTLRMKLALLPSKERKNAAKKAKKEEESFVPPTARLFILDFKGDVLASAVEALREEVTALLGVARAGDEVLVRLESSGGAVHSYGLAASQLLRLRAHGVALTVSVDRVAASGGYMMACVAPKIVAAPFAILGSIGVVAPVANVNKAITKLGLEYEDATAGKYKRTTTLLGKNTPEGRQKLQEQLEETHAHFKAFVGQMRPSLDVEAVATGEYWYGLRAKELGLVDELTTSDDFILQKLDSHRILTLECERPRSARERALSMVLAASGAASRALRGAGSERATVPRLEGPRL